MKKAGGYRIVYSIGSIKKYRRLSAKQKLDWLEAANHFTNLALTPKRKKVQEKFRRGEI